MEVVSKLYGEEFNKTVFTLYNNKNLLRYDLTVPLARYVAYNSIINMKRYAIGKVYRRDKAQMNKGRYREFNQCDFDIVGSSNSYMQEYEIITLIIDVLNKILGPNLFQIRINSRQLLYQLFSDSGTLDEDIPTICSSVDKYLDDLPQLKDVLIIKKIDDQVIDNIICKINSIKNLKNNNDILQFLDGYPTDILRYFADDQLLKDCIVVDPLLARGLDYYT